MLEIELWKIIPLENPSNQSFHAYVNADDRLVRTAYGRTPNELGKNIYAQVPQDNYEKSEPKWKDVKKQREISEGTKAICFERFAPGEILDTMKGYREAIDAQHRAAMEEHQKAIFHLLG